MTFFHADFGKEFPSRNLWRGPSRNCPSPSSVLCPLLYRTEHLSRGRKGQKYAEKRGELIPKLIQKCKCKFGGCQCGATWELTPAKNCFGRNCKSVGVSVSLGEINQKNPRVHKIFVRNAGAGNGRANFVGASKNAFFLQEKQMSIKFLLLEGKGILGFGGGECRFYFYGREDFSELIQKQKRCVQVFLLQGYTEIKETWTCLMRRKQLALQSPRPPTEVPNARHWKQPKNSRQGCRVGHGKAAEKQLAKQPKHPKNRCFDCFSAVFRVFRLFFRLFFGCFTVTHSAPFSAVFRLFSMSGIWHLCRWPRRLQN